MIEHLRPGATAKNAKVVLFDFDGTLSLIRSGWVEIMVPMMVEFLLELKTGESEEALREVVLEYVGRLTGKETIYQMFALCENITQRGGTPLDALVYKKIYLDRLAEKTKDRVAGLKNGTASPEEFLVPGSRALLDGLKERGLSLVLASGTDHDDVVAEAKLLQIDQYFDAGIFGALDDYKKFSKALVIKNIIESATHRGDQFLGFGDGYVEIENIKEVGGMAVGVASDEPECQKIDEWKRGRLVKVGADWIVPNFAHTATLFDTLFPND